MKETKAEAQVDADNLLTDAVTRDFHKGYDECRGPERHQIRIAYCRMYIETIKEGKLGDPTSRELLALTSLVRWYLSEQLLDLEGQLEEALQQMQTGLTEAKEARSHWSIYICLKEIGKIYDWMDDYNSAADYYRLALLHTRPDRQHEFWFTLYFLASVLSRAGKIAQAIFIFDWMMLLEPENIGTLQDKYEAMVKNRRRKDVEAIANSEPEANSVSYANHIAANYALKRYDEAATAAEAALKVARRERNPDWKHSFYKIIKLASKPPGNRAPKVKLPKEFDEWDRILK